MTEPLLGPQRLEVEPFETTAQPDKDTFLPSVSTPFAALNYVKATVGVGVLGLPYALRLGGLWVGCVGFFGIALVAYYCVTLLVEIRIYKKCEDYAECGRAAMGTGGVFLANTAVLCSQFGTHVVQMVFIATTLNTLVPVLPRVAWALILSPLFVVLACIRDTSHLRFVSAGGVLLLVVSMLVVVGFGFSNLQPSGVVAAQVNHAPIDLFLFFGTSIYVFEGINMIIPIHREMRHPESFTLMFALTSLALSVGFLVFAVIGYVCFLDAVQPFILGNLLILGFSNPSANAGYTAVSVLLMVELVLSFPLVFFPISRVIEHSVAPKFFGPSSSAACSSGFGWRRNVVRAGLVGLICLAATLIPHIGLAVALVTVLSFFCHSSHNKKVGSFAYALSGVILPTLFHLVVFWDSSRLHSKIINFVLVLVGIAAMAVTSTFVIARIANVAAGNVPQ